MSNRATSAITLTIRVENLFKPEEIPSEDVTKSISVPSDRKAARQLQSHWIRNKHQSLTKSNENTIFTILWLNTGYCTLCENCRKTVAKGTSYHIVKIQPIEKLLGSLLLLCLDKNTLVICLPFEGRNSNLHLSLISLPRPVHDILSVTL